jgi:molecular chaperone DnaJ
VPGKGHADPRHGSGDLYVSVDVGAHPFFHRRGRDLHVKLPVAVHEAALGAEIDVPTLTGSARLRIPPGTAGGQRLRLPGLGVGSGVDPDGSAGDLIVDVEIALPPVKDERSRELLREFGRLNNVDVRRHLF